VGAVTDWQEVAERVFVRRYDPFDVNVTVIAGEASSLLVDTRTTLREAREVNKQLEQLPIPPLGAVVVTHDHLDHCLGASGFPRQLVYASSGCARALADRGGTQREAWASWVPEELRPDLLASPLRLPDRTVADLETLDLGRRRVHLVAVGQGHTDHDLVVHAPDAEVVCAGDLVEEGAPPSFGDAFPFAWPTTLARVEALGAVSTVPGHGRSVDAAFVTAQHAELAAVANLCREVLGGHRTRASALRASPYPEATTVAALERAATTG
jgi:glyoxylase-like metal-dependent hydrolase (beta-lactamase superfamily II)